MTRARLHCVHKSKGEICRVIILSTLLYGTETWMVYGRHVKKLHTFMMKHMQSIMKMAGQGD